MALKEIGTQSIGAAELSAGKKWILILWTLFLSGALLWLGWSYVEQLSDNKTDSDTRHAERFTANNLEQGRTAEDWALPAGARPVQVHTGMYVDRVVGLDIKNSSWTVETLIWFKWNGDAVQPGENLKIVGASMDSKELEDSYDEGSFHYQRYRVVATISKIFDITRYPCDDHQLDIIYENNNYKRYEMIFIPDSSESAVNPQVRVPGYNVSHVQIIESPYTYRTACGDPRIKASDRVTVSQFKMGIKLARRDSSFYVKLSVTLFAAVALSLLMFLIDPSQIDARLALGLTGVFAAIGNTYVTSTLLPDIGNFAMIDTMNAFSFVVISIAVFEATMACYVTEKWGDVAFVKLMDYSTAFVLSVSYTVLNIAFYVAAN